MESQLHVVDGDGKRGIDNDVEGSDGGNGMGEGIQVDEGGDDVVSSGKESVEPRRSG